MSRYEFLQKLRTEIGLTPAQLLEFRELALQNTLQKLQECKDVFIRLKDR